MDILLKIIQFILSLSLLVIVHELGHFGFARLFGVRVERFSLFFGKPWFKFKRGDTEYCIGWFPFGGYVKLSGMIDESMDTKHIAEEPKPYEFRSKPAWQRLLIMTGGVMMNVVLAFVIYTGMIYTWGDAYISNQDARYGYVFNERMHELGFEDGDRIVSVNGKKYGDISKMVVAMIVEPDTPIIVERGEDNRQVTLSIPTSDVMTLGNSADMLAIRYPFVLSDVVEHSGAGQAGLQEGDKLIAINGEPSVYFDQYTRTLPDYKGERVDITFERDSAGVAVAHTVSVAVSENSTIGAYVDMESVTPIHNREYSLWASFPAGVKRVGTEISGYWKQLKLIVKPQSEGYKALGGPLAIGNIFPAKWDWYRFWYITGMLSIVLAVMNILPIPGLDGGHVLFLLVEVVTRRKPGTKFLINAQMVGMCLLMGVMVLAMWNDVMRLFVN